MYFTLIYIPYPICWTYNSRINNTLRCKNSFINRKTNNKLIFENDFIISFIFRCDFFFELFLLEN